MPETVLIRLERAITTLENVERRLSHVEEHHPAVLAGEIRECRKAIDDLKAEMRRELVEVKAKLDDNRRALWGIAMSVVAGALSVAFTAFQVWGGP